MSLRRTSAVILGLVSTTILAIQMSAQDITPTPAPSKTPATEAETSETQSNDNSAVVGSYRKCATS
jgi:hypothetical protein